MRSDFQRIEGRILDTAPGADMCSDVFHLTGYLLKIGSISAMPGHQQNRGGDAGYRMANAVAMQAGAVK
jgi:hypothetical protein